MTEVSQNHVAALCRADLRAIWKGEEHEITSYDGRRLAVTLDVLKATLGEPFSSAPLPEQAAFVAFCVLNRLDPLRRQAHFVRYAAGQPASFVVAWEVFLDRAQRHPQFDGYENGIVWRIRGEERWIVERGQPCDYEPDQRHVVAGAWCRVFRKDRKVPRYVEMPLSEMRQTKRDGTPVRAWAAMPITMALKVVTARALRQSFPEELAFAYTADESREMAAVNSEDGLASGDTAPPETLDAVAKRLESGEDALDIAAEGENAGDA